MKIYTSYFYKIRFFKPYMIPISTAKFDPAWYHQGQGQNHWFVDKNGVINGLRASVFSPKVEADCKTCDHTTCTFLPAYDRQLAELDISDITRRIDIMCNKVRNILGFTEEPIAVFIVHEAPNNPCSERASIQNYFRFHGIECEELQV